MKKDFTVKAFLTLISLVLVCLVFTSCGEKNIDIKKCCKINYSTPYNGYAKASLSVDDDYLDSLCSSDKMIKFLRNHLADMGMSKAEFEIILKTYKLDDDILPGLSDLIDFRLTGNKENLSNGDELTVEVSAGFADSKLAEYLKELGVKLNKTSDTIKVESLTDLESINIDLSKYIKVDFGKYDGYSTPTVTLDNEYLNSIVIWDIAKGNNYAPAIAEWLRADFSSAYNNIKNGDEIKVVVSHGDGFDSEDELDAFLASMALKLDSKEQTFTVSGLEKADNVIDIFDGIEQYIVYEGANGTGKVGNILGEIIIPDDFSKQIGDIYLTKDSHYNNTIKVIHKNTLIGKIGFSTSETIGENLSKGDKIELTAFDAENSYTRSTKQVFNDLDELGYIVPSTSKIVTVPDLGEYLTSQEQLTPAVIASIKELVCEKRTTDGIEKLYLGTFKPGVECKYNSSLFVEAIYYKGGWLKGYYIDTLYDIIIKSDGSVIVENYSEDSWPDDTLEIVMDKLNNSKNYSYSEIN